MKLSGRVVCVRLNNREGVRLVPGMAPLTKETAVLRWSRWFCLACVAGLFAGAPARADNLDLKLNSEMPEVIKFLQGKEYRNVGVLRFRAQRNRDKEPRFDVGPINGNMAERVENLLVMHAGDPSDGNKPILGVIHNASTQASRQKIGEWFTNPAEREKLFKVAYPLAWGKETVQADAFLTGVVSHGKDMKTTTVRLELFDSKAPERLVKVKEFTVETDQHLIRDFNYPYSLKKEQRVALVRARGGERESLENGMILEGAQRLSEEEAEAEEKATEKPREIKLANTEMYTPENVGGIKVTIKVGETMVEPRPGPSVGQYQMECPPRGQPIVVYLENTTDKHLGVVLKVGGRNTLGLEMQDARQCRKWVVPPGKTYDIEGFYTGKEFDDLARFALASKDDLKDLSQQLGDKLELIEIYTFAAEPVKKEAVLVSRSPSARGMRGDREKTARSTFASAREALMKDGLWKKTRERGVDVIVPNADTIKVDNPKEVDFPNPVEIGNLKIKLMPRE